MGSAELEKLVLEIRDRQSINDTILKLCRAVDRCDDELLKSCFHEDAIDDHGVFVGKGHDLGAWSFPRHIAHEKSWNHYCTNITCDLEGDVAHTEAYFLYVGVDKLGGLVQAGGGRYFDRHERRDGRWAIAARKCVVEWGGNMEARTYGPEMIAAFARVGTVAHDRSDISYTRPLTTDDAPVGFSL